LKNPRIFGDFCYHNSLFTLIDTILYLNVPPGASTSAISPTLFESKDLPTGDRKDTCDRSILPCDGSTILNRIISPSSISFTKTSVPIITNGIYSLFSFPILASSTKFLSELI
ncbi:MAG: hypothetical protein QME46_09645, partial [Thermoanaerobacteraceae bacterium]|nr:hypothetical protein [Thermoanaerobacteraceae bacterium]